MEQNARILVVDDEEKLLHLLSEMLMEFGWSVATASHPDEALAMVKAERFHMAFVDNRLGPLEGVQLVERMREADEELPCVLMSGDLNVETTAHALKKGVAGFLRKPFRVEALLVSIEHGNKTREYHRRAKELLADLENSKRRT